MRRRRVLLGVLASLVVAGAANAAPIRSHLVRPALEAPPPFATSFAPINDRVIRGPAPRSLAAEEWWGGPITNSRGETFNIYVSKAFPVDEAARAQWANFLGWALHGQEIRDVTLYQAPLAGVEQACGGEEGVLGCYYPDSERIYFPGDRGQEGNLNVAEILLHEFGHHVAWHRKNDPWLAITWGAKNWASFENVCTRASRGTLFPGNEGTSYLLNPGDGFAETYRQVNVTRAASSNSAWYQSWGKPLPWQFLAFSRDADAQKAVQEDVLQPWTGPRTVQWSGRTRTQSILEKQVGEFSATRRVITPLDGTIMATLQSGPPGSYVVLKVGFLETSARRRAKAAVCGESSYQVVVKTVRPAPFKVSISIP